VVRFNELYLVDGPRLSLRVRQPHFLPLGRITIGLPPEGELLPLRAGERGPILLKDDEVPAPVLDARVERLRPSTSTTQVPRSPFAASDPSADGGLVADLEHPSVSRVGKSSKAARSLIVTSSLLVKSSDGCRVSATPPDYFCDANRPTEPAQNVAPRDPGVECFAGSFAGLARMSIPYHFTRCRLPITVQFHCVNGQAVKHCQRHWLEWSAVNPTLAGEYLRSARSMNACG